MAALYDTTGKVRALRTMKIVATGAFLLMALIFFLTEPLGSETIIWVIRWDHINAFAEAAMVGALADWFAVVALFRHPLGIPIWHTAIIPRKKEEIGRNLGDFVENRLLSVDNITQEVSRFSASAAALNYLSTEGNRVKVAGWATDALRAIVHQLDDEEIEQVLRDIVIKRLSDLNASRIIGNGLELIIRNNKHEQLIDSALHHVAEWLPSRRETIHEFIESAMRRMLKWGSKLVPDAAIDKATDQALVALIEILHQAANDPAHPLRADLEQKTLEWVEKLNNDPEWQDKINEWKQELIEYPALHTYVSNIWTEAKAWITGDLDTDDSTIRNYAEQAITSFYNRLESDEELRELLDGRLRSVIISFLHHHHNEIGSLIQRIVDSWDAKELSRELELNLGRDLQYIRLNGTFIGGTVGLLIHLIR